MAHMLSKAELQAAMEYGDILGVSRVI